MLACFRGLARPHGAGTSRRSPKTTRSEPAAPERVSLAELQQRMLEELSSGENVTSDTIFTSTSLPVGGQRLPYQSPHIQTLTF